MRARPGLAAARAIKLILGLQIALALVLFGVDFARVLPNLGLAPAAPRLTAPVLPGDQTRRFDPRHVPVGPRAPNNGPDSRPDTGPDTGDMPSRLLFALEGGRLSLTGAIAEGDAARLADWMQARELPQAVALHSAGGSVQDALEIGRWIRRVEATTELGAGRACLSACPYLLAAGTERRVHKDAYVGVHQHYFGENTALPAFLAVEDIQRGQGEVMGYLIEMGIDPALMQHALVTPPEAIYILVEDELTGYALATEILDAEAAAPPEGAGNGT